MVQPKSNRFLVESMVGGPNGVAGLGVDAKVPTAQLPRGSASGLASLDAGGLIPETQMPSPTDGAGWWAAILTKLKALFPQKADLGLNILDFGVVRGTATSQTAAIKAALDSRPGEAFYFPPGDYRLDTGLVIAYANVLNLAFGARIYAGAPMTTMITYLQSAAGYAEDKAIIGGLLDGNLKADRILSLGKVIRFTLTLTNFKDGIKRGLVTEAGLGAELFAYDLRFYNTTATNVADNIAIEAKMGDSHFRDIVIRDWTTAVKDTSANRWNRIHPWISQDTQANPQMTNRYPTSIAFDLTGSSDVTECVSDTYRTGYKLRSNGTAYTAPPRLLNSRAMWAVDPMLTNAQAAANPAYIFDNTDGVGVTADRLTATGHSSTYPANLFTGPATNLNIAIAPANTGYVKGAQGTMSDPLNYRAGIQQGMFTFTPTIIGSGGAGAHAYTTQSGRMVVDGDTTTYFIRVRATLDATSAFQGVARISGLPIPTGATNVRDGAGSVGWAQNIPVAATVIYANTAPYVSLMKLDPLVGMSEIDIAGSSLRGKVIDLILSVTVTHYKQ